MHKNHRRKNHVKNFRPRWRYSLHWWKQSYWSKERARAKTLMVKDRFDDLQIVHPKSILWDVL
jgi:hypothetical protein